LFFSGFLFYISANYQKAEAALEDEKRKSEELLHNILPVPIARRLKETNKAIADGFKSTTILFADIVGFTPLSEKMTPEELVALLNKIFTRFDHLAGKHKLEKIKTIGDAYMVAGGLPIPDEMSPMVVADFALEMRDSVSKFNDEHDHNLSIRIGIHTGPTVARVIGVTKFSYDVWGNTVNTASRMESHGLPGKIQVSEDTYQFLKDNYTLVDRGILEIKGKGPTRAYLLEAKNQE